MKEDVASVTVLGVSVRRATMPEIFRLARSNPKSLKLVLEGIMAKRGFKKPMRAMSLLEGDLGYKNQAPDKP